MLETLNRADHGHGQSGATFHVSVRAELAPEPAPGPADDVHDWPADASGYTTDLTVIACDEAEAREFALQYLQQLDPTPLAYDVRVVGRGGEGHDEGGRARGVARINGSRAYFRGERVAAARTGKSAQ